MHMHLPAFRSQAAGLRRLSAALLLAGAAGVGGCATTPATSDAFDRLATRPATVRADAPVAVPFDPVVLVERGERVAGDPALEVVEAGFAYRFVDEASRARFLDESPRHRVAMGGACARMGPLSGAGDPSRVEAWNGRLFLFASDECRRAFLAAPAAFVEPAPEVRSAQDPGRPGGELLRGKAARWLGTEDLAPGSAVGVELARDEESGGRTWRVVERRVSSTGLRHLAWTGWDDEAWWTEASFGGAAASGLAGRTAGTARALDQEQLAAFAREALREPVFAGLVLARGEAACSTLGAATWDVSDDSLAAGAAPETLRGEILEIVWRGARVEWLVEPLTGRPLAARGIFRQADGRMGEELVAFGEWTETEGVRVPLARARRGAPTTRFDAMRLERP